MSLDIEVFREGMKRLANAFNRTVSTKIIDGWFDELERCDENVFVAAIKGCIREDHYPNLGQFWARYNEVSHRVGTKDKEVHGCDKCCNGYVHFLQFDYKSKAEHEVVAFCKSCFPEMRRNTTEGDLTFKYVPGTEPFLNQDGDVMIPRFTVPAMLQDLTKLMFDPTTDWEHEIRKAEQQHQNAVKHYRKQKELERYAR